MGGDFFIFWGGELNGEKITKIKYDQGLRWPPFNILHATTNQKLAGVMEGGWDRPQDHARTLRDCDGNDKPLAEGDNTNNGEYNKDGDIPNDNNKYAVGLTVLTSLLTRATASMKLSALPLRKPALRVSG
jgi:hypothetical protein